MASPLHQEGKECTVKFVNVAGTDEDDALLASHRSTEAKELVVPEKKNWKGIFLSIVVISVVCIVVGVSAWLLQPPESSDNFKYVYDFDAMFDTNWKPHRISGQWIRDSFVYRDRFMNVVRRTGTDVEVLISNDTTGTLGIYEAAVSPDLKYALLAYNVKRVFRHSTTAEYYVYEIATGAYLQLHEGRLQHAAWGTQGSQLTFVADFNLYYKSDTLATPEALTSHSKGMEGTVRSGIADWVYEEEIFSSATAHWFSSGGSHLAYVTFNDTLVPQVDILIYKMPYPEVRKISYPKAGSTNPSVKLHVYDLEAKKRLKISIPESLKAMEVLLSSFVWATDNMALVTWSNRYQNVSVTSSCSVPDTFKDHALSCREVHTRRENGWIENVSTPPVPGPGMTFFQIAEKPLGGRGKFHHLLMVNYSTNPSTSRFLTSGNWEVDDILGYNSDLDRVYYTSTERSPMDRHLYSVSLSEGERPTTVCQSCKGLCKYAKLSVSSSAKRALLNCEGPGVPYASMLDLGSRDRILLEDNYELKEKVREAKLPDVTLEKVAIKGEVGNYDFLAKLFLPPNAKLKKDLPLLVDIYAAPGRQKVDSRFFLDWTTYLATNKDVAVLVFDGRGSGFRGSNAMKEVNRQLGNFEVEDHITAIEQVIRTHPYLSKTKIGIWGWSYGGYASAKLATHPRAWSRNLTKCVISVAPVTDWNLYDSVYTERYMGSPNANAHSYAESSLLSKARFFARFDYLLVHGTMDDNVHFQNSAVLEEQLVRAGIVHRYQVYTDEAHSLSNDPRRTHRHLYSLMTQFLMECYQKA